MNPSPEPFCGCLDSDAYDGCIQIGAFLDCGRSACALLLAGAALLPASASRCGCEESQVLVRDITSVEGVRDNMLVGYGLVVGLNRTGDTQQTYFTVQTLANAMQRMGVLISPGIVKSRMSRRSLLPHPFRRLRAPERSWT